jgi:hypothetical protein
MNKQQTIELLKQQLPGFYSVEQVINIINDVDTGSSGLSEEKLTEISESIYDVIEKKMREVDASDVVDFSSAEFSIEYDNRLALEAIDISSDTIAEMIANDVKDYLKDFFTPNDITE